MKAFLFSLSFLFVLTTLSAQKWVEMMDDPNENFYNVQREFNQYYQNRPTGKGTGWKQFKRWEYYMEQRVYPTGFRPGVQEIKEELENYNNLRNTPSGSSQRLITANWKAFGPTSWTATSYNPGNGRINCITVDPNDSDVIYIGTPSGGLWKTTDGGKAWSPMTDKLTNLGITSIAIHPASSDTIYAATGDGFGGYTYSLGVIRSTDGGKNWSYIGPNWNTTNYVRSRDLIIHPRDHDSMVLVSSAGIYFSANAGSSWSRVQTGNFYDLEIHPSNPDTIYASGSGTFYRSTNGGASWSQVTTGLPSSGTRRIAIAVTPDDADYVYLLASNTSNGFYGLYRSTNSGGSFSQRSTSPNILGYSITGNTSGGQAWYDLALAVHPNDKDEVYVGGINIWKSTDGGSNWSMNAYWYRFNTTYPYVHADIHSLDFYGNTLYAGCDGGIFQTKNGGQNWKDLSAGLAITQYYRLGGTEADADLLVAGSQDNGTNRVEKNRWIHILGADGMEASIDPTNSNTIYACIQNGGMRKSTNGGTTFSTLNVSTTERGAWVTPHMLDPNNSNTLFVGYSNVWKSTNGGSSFSRISNFSTGRLAALTVAEANSNYIYCSVGSTLYGTANGGTSWSTLSGSLPNRTITYIAVDANDEERLWVTFSGYSSGTKVYFSDDAGATWTNMSGTLPNIPVNCVVHQKGSNDALYVGTDVGVYYRDSLMTDWAPFNNNLPNVIVRELEINYKEKLLRAATLGRGIWESDLVRNFARDVAAFELVSPADKNSRQFSQNAFGDKEDISARIVNLGTDTLKVGDTITVGFYINGGKATEEAMVLKKDLLTDDDTVYTFSSKLDMQQSGDYEIGIYARLKNDEFSANDSLELLRRQIANPAVFLPWTDGFEGTRQSEYSETDAFALEGAEHWDYELSEPQGRLRLDAGSAFTKTGSHAATLDRTPNGSDNTNYLLLNLNMSRYTKRLPIRLSFSYMDHGDENSVGDKVWVRGEEGDSWIELYNLLPQSQTNGQYNDVKGINIDSALAANNQKPSATTQLRFGQQDNFPATSTTGSDGITYDDIEITAPDLALGRMTSPVSGCGLGSQEIIRVVLKNNSSLTWPTNEEIPLAFDAGDGNVKREVHSLRRALNPGDSVAVTLRARADLSTPGYYPARLWLDFGNADAANDTARAYIVSLLAPEAPTATGAERCGPGVLSLTGSPGLNGDTIVWYGSANGTNAQHIGATYSPTLSASRSYWVSSRNNSNGCESATRVKVDATILSLPELATAQDASRCGPGSVSLNASPGNGADSIRWYSDSIAGSPLAYGTSYSTASLNASRSFYVSSYNSSTGCEIRNKVSVEILTLPNDITGVSAERCGSGDLALKANLSGTADSAIWKDLQGKVVGTGQTLSLPALFNSTDYQLFGINRQSGCESANGNTVRATINAIPALAQGSGVSLCALEIGRNVRLSASPGIGGNDIRWYADSAAQQFVAQGDELRLRRIKRDTIMYALSIDTVTGCSGLTHPFKVRINPIPTVRGVLFSNNKLLLAPDSACVLSEVSIGARTTISGGFVRDLVWDLGDTTFKTGPDTNFSYTYLWPGQRLLTAQAISDQGCIGVGQQYINILPLPNSAFSFTRKFRTFTLIADDQNLGGYRWDFGDGNTDNSNKSRLTHTFSNDGDYTVRLEAESAFGCVSSTEQEINLNTVGLPEIAGLKSLSAFPNPFRGKAVVELVLDAQSQVDLALYDLNGRKISTLNAWSLNAGKHQLPISAKPGAYLIRGIINGRALEMSIISL